MSETQALGVELAVDFTPGEPIRWAAFSQMPPHFAGEGSTPVGYGATPDQALAELHAELQSRAMGPQPASEATEVSVTEATEVWRSDQ